MKPLMLPSHSFKNQTKIVLHLHKHLNNSLSSTDISHLLYIIKSTALFLECSNKLNACDMTLECADYMAWMYEEMKREVTYMYKKYETKIPISIMNEKNIKEDTGNTENVRSSKEKSLEDSKDKNSSDLNDKNTNDMKIIEDISNNEGNNLNNNQSIKNTNSNNYDNSNIYSISLKNDIFMLNDTETEHINRLTKIFLHKYNLSFFTVKITNGWVILKSKYFTLHAVLCGDLTNPIWKIIKTISLGEINSEIFSSIQDLDEILIFIEYYENCRESKELISNFSNICDKIQYTIEGDYNHCVISVYTLKIVIRIVDNQLRCSINDDFIDTDILENIKCRISDFMYKSFKGLNATFDFENGIMYKNKKIENNEIESILKTETEDKIFNMYKNVGSKYFIVRNYSYIKFGMKNIFMHNHNNFICVRLDNLKIYIGKINEIEKFKELYICSNKNTIIKEKIKTNIENFEELYMCSNKNTKNQNVKDKKKIKKNNIDTKKLEKDKNLVKNNSIEKFNCMDNGLEKQDNNSKKNFTKKNIEKNSTLKTNENNGIENIQTKNILNENNGFENNGFENNGNENNGIENIQTKNNGIENILNENNGTENIQTENIQTENIQTKNFYTENNSNVNFNNENIQTKNIQTKNIQTKNIQTKNISNENIYNETFLSENFCITNNPLQKRLQNLDHNTLLFFIKTNLDTLIYSIDLYSYNFKIKKYTYLSCQIRNYNIFCKINNHSIKIKHAKKIHNDEDLKYKKSILKIDNIANSTNAIKFIILKEIILENEFYKIINETDNEISVLCENYNFKLSFHNKIIFTSSNKLFESLMTKNIDEPFYFTDLISFLLQFLTMKIYPLSFINDTITIPTHHILKKNIHILFIKPNLFYMKNSKKMISLSTYKNFFNAIKTIFCKNRFYEIKIYVCDFYKLVKSSVNGTKVYESVDWFMIFDNGDFQFKVFYNTKFGVEIMDQRYENLNGYVSGILGSESYYLKIFDYMNEKNIDKIKKKALETK